jgi:hypothetical protein
LGESKLNQFKWENFKSKDYQEGRRRNLGRGDRVERQL